MRISGLVSFSQILNPIGKKMKKNLIYRALTFGTCFSLALIFSATQVSAQSGTSAPLGGLGGSGTSQVIQQAVPSPAFGSATSQAIPQASSFGSGSSQVFSQPSVGSGSSVISSSPVASSPVYSSAPVESFSSAPISSAPTSSCCGGSAPTTTYYSAPAPAPVYSAPVYSAPVYSAPVQAAPCCGGAPVAPRPRLLGGCCGCR